MNLADKLGFGPKRVVVTDGTLYRVDVTPPAFMKLPTQSVLLDTDQYHRYQAWLAGATIQDVLPDLTPSQREILMSGIGDDDFNKLYPEDEDESNSDRPKS
jgi:hypothetical protein